MLRRDFKKGQALRLRSGQAATELAVFGAILIFLIGSIVRNAIGNSYEQNQNFKAMRMAMLASWNDSKANPGMQPQITAHNSANILFLEDKLAPDYGKYGAMDRTPYVASGAGTFSYNLLYPLSDAQDEVNALPVMDLYVNGQHFPLSMASFVLDWAITPDALLKEGFPACPASGGQPSTTGPISQQQCLQNQSCRFQREWAGGTIKLSQFQGIVPVSSSTITSSSCESAGTPEQERECQDAANACTIFVQELGGAGVVSLPAGSNCTNNIPTQGRIAPELTSSTIASSSLWTGFVNTFNTDFPNQPSSELTAILTKLQNASNRYKLFYTLVPNPGPSSNSSTPGGPNFSTSAWNCTSHPCENEELSTDAPLYDYNGNPVKDGLGSPTNSNGVMQYDLLRNADYSTTTGVLSPSQFPNPGCTSNCLRSYIAWQWQATAGTSADMVGLNAANNQFPTYDIDGRLKEVTLYNIRTDASGVVHVMYEDSQGGDIDGTWDLNSCGPKPGLQEDAQIFTFTKNGNNATSQDGGTYLLIKEGKLYNPETGFVVRSANKRDTIDLIQRTIQLSNNTHRFCDIYNQRLPYVGMVCPDGSSNCALAQMSNPPNLIVNPVEVCVSESTPTDNCFQEDTIKETCYDTNPGVNKIFVRSRLQDRRGNSWVTNTTGQLQVNK